ncbi:MAG: hypothetical protein J6R48_00795 [Muribaculaceae bacterium]|nr:hypothetical protein [Muribaculaceae bacterium]
MKSTPNPQLLRLLIIVVLLALTIYVALSITGRLPSIHGRGLQPIDVVAVPVLAIAIAIIWHKLRKPK